MFINESFSIFINQLPQIIWGLKLLYYNFGVKITGIIALINIILDIILAILIINTLLGRPYKYCLIGKWLQEINEKS